VCTSIVTCDAYAAFAAGFGNMDTLMAPHHIWLSVPVLGGIIACTVQLFYAYRLKLFSGSWHFSLGPASLAITALVAALITGGKAYYRHVEEMWRRDILISAGIWFGSCAACDLAISGCMVYQLLRRDDENARIHALITRLIRITVETGIITAVASIVNLIIFLAVKPHYASIISFIIAKLYSNAMVAVLNNRIISNQRLRDVEDSSTVIWMRTTVTDRGCPQDDSCHPPDQDPSSGTPQGKPVCPREWTASPANVGPGTIKPQTNQTDGAITR